MLFEAVIVMCAAYTVADQCAVGVTKSNFTTVAKCDLARQSLTDQMSEVKDSVVKYSVCLDKTKIKAVMDKYHATLQQSAPTPTVPEQKPLVEKAPTEKAPDQKLNPAQEKALGVERL